MSWLKKNARHALWMVPAIGAVSEGIHQYDKHQQRNKAKGARREDIASQNLDMLQSSITQGGSYQDIVMRVAKGYQGKANQLPQFLEQNKHLLITGLLNTDAAKDLTDQGRFLGATYAPAVGQMAQAQVASRREAAGGLARSGLSAAGVGPAMAQRARLSMGASRGAMYADLIQQHLNARYNLQRDVAGMAMGFPPQQAQGKPGTDYSDIIGALIGAGGRIASAAI